MGCLDWITHGRARFIMQSLVSVLIVLGGFSMILVPPFLAFDRSDLYITPGVIMVIFIAGRWFSPVENPTKTREQKRKKLLEKMMLVKIALGQTETNVDDLLDNDEDLA